MLRFVVRRLLLLIPILIGLSILVFIWIRALPGSPAEALLGEHSTPEAAARLRHQYGLDQPVYAQYWAYLKTIASGNLGTSIASTRTVTYELEHRFPATIELALAAMIFAISVGIPLGFLSAKKYRSGFDHAGLAASLIGISIPIFFLAIILKYIFSVRLGWLPSIGREDALSDASHPTNFYVLDGIITGNLAASWDAIKHLILPAIALGSIPLAIIARITRASVLDVQNEDYVRTARAHGRPSPRDAECPAAGHHDHRPADGPAAQRRGADGDGLCNPGNGVVARAGDLQPRLPGAAGRNSLPRHRVRAREPPRRHLVRA